MCTHAQSCCTDVRREDVSGPRGLLLKCPWQPLRLHRTLGKKICLFLLGCPAQIEILNKRHIRSWSRFYNKAEDNSLWIFIFCCWVVLAGRDIAAVTVTQLYKFIYTVQLTPQQHHVNHLSLSPSVCVHICIYGRYHDPHPTQNWVPSPKN